MLIRKRLVVALLAPAVGCALLGATGWVWRHPDAFETVPAVVSMSSDSWDGHTLFVGMTHERLATPRETLTLHSVKANIEKNTARATVEFYICEIDPESRFGSVGAVDEAEVKKGCSALSPVRESHYEIGAQPRQQLVMAVTATQQGEVVIAGAALTYSRGWQRGTQDIGEHVVLRTRG